jgi:septum site-determining protein MinD
MARVIVISSGKGGVGKTTTAINLGAALNKLKQNVILVDANLNTPNIGIHLGAPIVPVTLNHVLKGKAEIGESIYEHSSGTKIIPASLSVKEVRKFNTKTLPSITDKLRKMADFVIFDSAAGFGDEVLSCFEASDEIIIVTNPEMPSVTDALKAIKVAKEMGKEVKGVIITRYRGKKYEMPLNSIKSMLETPIIGVIPEDDSVKESVNQRDAVIHTHPNSRVARKYNEIAVKVLGKEASEDLAKNRSFLSDFFWKIFGK